MEYLDLEIIDRRRRGKGKIMCPLETELVARVAISERARDLRSRERFLGDIQLEPPPLRRTHLRVVTGHWLIRCGTWLAGLSEGEPHLAAHRLANS
jgi:hypothetical protein